MKKLFAAVFMLFAAFTFSPQAIFAAEGDTVPPTEEVIDYDEEVAVHEQFEQLYETIVK
mgnify:CR=1 FL=1